MAIVNIITANCESNQLSQQMVSRQWDDKGTLIQFAGYPEPEGDEELIFRLIVWMKESEDAEPRELPPILLDADQWLVSNYYTQMVQTIKFQLCITNESGTFEKHSPIFAGHIGRSLSHNGQEGEIDVIPLFDPYMEYVDEKVSELIVAAGDVQIDASLSTSGAAADAKATGDAIANVNGRLTQHREDLNDIANDGTMRLPEPAFVLGSLNVNTGDIVNGYTYRCATNQSIVYSRDITITPQSGYRAYLLYMTGGTVFQTLGWQTNNFTIPANQEFRIIIAKVTEDTSSTANIPAYVDALSVSTYISNLEKRVEKIENNEHFEPVEVQSTNVFDKSNTDLILTGKTINSSGDVSDSANFSVIKIPVNGIDGNEYNLYLPNTGNTGYIAVSTRFAMYDANGGKIGLIVNGTTDPAVITDDRCRYLYIPIASANIDKAMVLTNVNGGTLPIYLPIPYKKHFVYDLHWYGKGWSSYGDSISAINNGDFIGKGWAGIVNYEYGFSKFHGRSVGGQTFKWGTGGGAVTFVKANGDYYDRNGNYNLDNYDGSVPSGCKAVRGCMCSWIKIKEMYPESIKDDVDMVFIMAGSNDIYTANEELRWIDGDTTDPEWAASEEYATYGGDYNIATTIGAVASTVMKFQAWLPNSIIVLGTPLNGNVETNPPTIRPGYIPDEYYKNEYIKKVANIFGIPCIDVFGTCGINVLNAPTYILDAVHPYTENGCKMLARAVIGGLKSIYPHLT